MTNRLVFREEPLNDNQILHRNEHNERLLYKYNNGNIDLSKSSNNIYFKKPEKLYGEIFNEKLNNGDFNTKGLKPDAAHYSEILVGVNIDYWTDKSPEYIYKFFETAYEHYKKKFGEKNVISAVVHTDEIYEGKINYHMHIVALPIVKKRRYYGKRSKQYKALVETGEKNIKKDDERLLKTTEKQISHSKFFECPKSPEHRITYSYSVWQDELLKELHGNGFTDIHRGVQGTKSVHLHPTQFKNLMDNIEAQADGLLEDIKVKPVDKQHYLVDKQSYQKMLACKESVSKEKATYDLAVAELVKQQSLVYERQHKVYQTEQHQKEVEISEEEIKSLKEKVSNLLLENEQLKKILNYLKTKMYKLCQCFGNIVSVWTQVRNNPDGKDVQGAISDIDNEIINGVSVLMEDTETKSEYIR